MYNGYSVLGRPAAVSARLAKASRFLLFGFVALLCRNLICAEAELPELYRLRNISSNGSVTVGRYAFISNMPIGELSGVSVWKRLLTNEVVFLKV